MSRLRDFSWRRCIPIFQLAFFSLIFNRPIFLQWLGRQSFLDDLSSLDPDLYNGLIFLKHYTGSVEELSLNFTMAVEGMYNILFVAVLFLGLDSPQYHIFPQNSGRRKPWTSSPTGATSPSPRKIGLRIFTSSLIIVWASRSSSRAMRFLKGCRRWLIRSGLGMIFILSFYCFFFRRRRWRCWIFCRMFNQQEVQILIGGVNSPIDLDDLRRNTNYGGLYDDNHETVVMFWNVSHLSVAFSIQVNVCSIRLWTRLTKNSVGRCWGSLRAVVGLRCCTCCVVFLDSPVFLFCSHILSFGSGFKELVPNFSIRDAGADQYRLPTSSTCVNLLKVGSRPPPFSFCLLDRLFLNGFLLNSYRDMRRRRRWGTNCFRRLIRVLDLICREVEWVRWHGGGGLFFMWRLLLVQVC